jgi:hypothetical protein
MSFPNFDHKKTILKSAIIEFSTDFDEENYSVELMIWHIFRLLLRMRMAQEIHQSL